MYCENCGALVPEKMVNCPNCGAQVKGNNQTGATNEINQSKQELLDVGNMVAKSSNSTSSVAESSVGFINLSSVKTMESLDLSSKSINTKSQSTVSTAELWTWLKRGSKRTQYYTEQITSIEIDEFKELLNEKLSKNNVPAKVSLKNVKWDLGRTSQNALFIEPSAEAVNILTCILQYEKVGNFVYVEEKTFITPPELPTIPGKFKEISPYLKEDKMLLGIGLGIAGLIFLMNSPMIGLVGLVVAGVLLYDAFKKRTELESLESHNRNVELQQQRWESAWNEWQKNIFAYAFQEDVNGIIGRIYDSVAACVKQVCDENFKVQKVKETEENTSMNELEQMISRRKDEYK